MRFITQKQIACGEMIPRGWGYVRDDRYSDRVCIAPIPLNFVFGAWYWFYFRVLSRGMKDPLVAERNYWRSRGWHEGYQDGYEAGIKHKTIVQGDTAEDLAHRTAPDADRPGRDDRGETNRVVTDDAERTICTGCYSTLCICPTLTVKVSTRPQARRSKLRPVVLDRSGQPAPDTISVVAPKRIRRRAPRVGKGRTDAVGEPDF
jgi:hypothetical protein